MPVSLFYHYTDINDVSTFAHHLDQLGKKLHLSGRIRVSTEGINGTFAGDTTSVNTFHHQLLSLLNNPTIDFKVSPGSITNFPQGWRVRICKELVTIGLSPSQLSWRDAANHITPYEFRQQLIKELQNPSDQLIILDVRNQYEHAIGRFKNAILPPIRQFSDFPQFIKQQQQLIKGKRVLMYCTGGIRCERASAYLKGLNITQSIAQLEGGIDRFLTNFPCGGDVFEGKNLVFDTRMAVGTEKGSIVGQCVVCADKWDDYTAGWRCKACRMRVLLCEKKQCVDTFYNNMEGICSTCPARQKI